MKSVSKIRLQDQAIWGNTKAARKNDYFVGTHNIRTPESFWKVVIAGDGSTIAWLIPNDQNATTAKLDTFLIKPVQLELKAKFPNNSVSKD